MIKNKLIACLSLSMYIPHSNYVKKITSHTNKDETMANKWPQTQQLDGQHYFNSSIKYVLSFNNSINLFQSVGFHYTLQINNQNYKKLNKHYKDIKLYRYTL